MRDQQCGAKADLRRDGITDTESADLFTALYFYVDQGVNYGEFSGLSPSCIEGQGSFSRYVGKFRRGQNDFACRGKGGDRG